MSFKILLVGAMVVALGCANTEPVSPPIGDGALFQLAPADGSRKIVSPIEFTIPGFTTCADGTTLDLQIVGWIQDRPGSDPAPRLGVVDFAFEFTFLNAAGESYVWHQVGSALFQPDENGDMIIATAGRTLDLIGRIVINGETGEVLSVAGRQPQVEATACAAL